MDVTPGQMAGVFNQVATKTLPSIGASVIREIAKAIWDKVLTISPIARANVAGKGITSRHPGLYFSSHRISIGSPVDAGLSSSGGYALGAVRPAGYAAIANFRPANVGTPLVFRNDAGISFNEPYPDILEQGRHVDSLGRMAGSTQAPHGIYGPSLEQVSADPQVVGLGVVKGVLEALPELGAHGVTGAAVDMTSRR